MNSPRVLVEVENDDVRQNLILEKGWICNRCNTSVNPNEKVCPSCNKLKENCEILKGREILCG